MLLSGRFVETDDGILGLLRFHDLSTRVERMQTVKLALFRKITDTFAKNYRRSYNPSTYGTNAERLVTFQVRCLFKGDTLSKSAKYGKKLWALCDADNFYCCSFEVYVGKVNGVPEKNHDPRHVKFWQKNLYQKT